MSLRWLSFADGNLPTGQQYLGAVIIDAMDFIAAIRMTHALGINPGGEVVQFECDPAQLAARVPPAYRERLLSRADLEELFDDLESIDELEAS